VFLYGSLTPWLTPPDRRRFVRVEVRSYHINTTMTTEYCRLLSNGAHFTSDKIKFQPCCWVQPKDVEITNFDDLVSVRETVTAEVLSDKDKFCKECINREQYGYSKSFRQRSNEFIPINAIPNKIYVLTLQIDTTCNAACVMCSSTFSSLWSKQDDPTYKLKDFSSEYKNLKSLEDWSQLTRLTIAGGEPFLSENNLDFIKSLPFPENVVISFNTNGSIVPNDEWAQALSKFKKLIISFSIDGINDQFNYIRWPLQWSKVSQNIVEFLKNYKKYNNETIWAINITINPMNIIQVPDIIEHFNNIADTVGVRPPLIFKSVCYGTWGLDATPQEIRNFVNSSIDKKYELSNLLESQPEVIGKFNNLISNMKDLDSIRNLFYEKTFADSFKIINNGNVA
jgi:organic radical activating enzyme